MKTLLLILTTCLALCLPMAAQTQTDYLAFVVSQNGPVATAAGAQIPTQILVFGRPVAADKLVQVSVVTPEGTQTMTVNQPGSRDASPHWVHFATVHTGKPGLTVSSVSVAPLTVGAAVSAPIVQ